MNYSIIANDMIEIFSNGLDYSLLNNKTIMITGAYGMIASYIVKFLLYVNQSGIKIKILALVKNKEKFYQRFPECRTIKNVVLYETDLSKRIIIEEKVDYIIHAASFASPDYYNVCPVEVIEPNVTGTINLLEFAKSNLRNEGCFIFFSAGNIYGTCDSNKQITEETFGGMDPLHIYNCYCCIPTNWIIFCSGFYQQISLGYVFFPFQCSAGNEYGGIAISEKFSYHSYGCIGFGDGIGSFQ